MGNIGSRLLGQATYCVELVAWLALLRIGYIGLLGVLEQTRKVSLHLLVIQASDEISCCCHVALHAIASAISPYKISIRQAKVLARLYLYDFLPSIMVPALLMSRPGIHFPDLDLYSAST